MRAIAVLRDDKGVPCGTVHFSQRLHCRMKISVDVRVAHGGTGLRGFHVHCYGDTSKGCASMGPHFNPDGHAHGGRPVPTHGATVHPRHAGDLGNVRMRNGVVKQTIFAPELSLHPSSPYFVVGRGVVLHAREDDLGKTTHPESSKTGNAGPRLACGAIVWCGATTNHATKVSTRMIAS